MCSTTAENIQLLKCSDENRSPRDGRIAAGRARRSFGYRSIAKLDLTLVRTVEGSVRREIEIKKSAYVRILCRKFIVIQGRE